MHTLRLKVINSGVSLDRDDLTSKLTELLTDEGYELSEKAPLTIKIKFMEDNDLDVVLIQLRETGSKVKLREKVIPFISTSWLNDTVMEVNAIVSSTLELETS